MKKWDKKLRRFLKYAILFAIIFGLLLTFSNLTKFKQLFLELNFVYFSAAVIGSLIIYGFEGIFLHTALNLFKEKLPIMLALKYSLIINAIGYFISFGGLTPFATQIHVLDYQNINIQKATASRVLHVLFFNAFFNILLIIGLVSILLNNRSGDYNLTVVIITTSFFLILIIGFYLAIFWTSFRDIGTKVFFTILNGIIALFSKKFKLSPKWALCLLEEFNKGFNSTLKKPLYLVIFFIITVIDWLFWLLVMYFSFLTVNYPIKIGTLIIGFSIGQIVSILSMVPGGAGTMEGSMALVYNILSIPLATALVAILIYRISFYIFPFFLSLPFYFSLKRKIEEES